MTAARAARRCLLFIWLVLASAALAGCGGADREQGRLCREAIAALEPTGSIIIRSAGRDAAEANAVSVAYEIEGDDGLVRYGTARCQFGGGRLDGDRLDLIAVQHNGADIGEARLFFLERFWLGDRRAVAEGDRRFTDTGETPLLALRLGLTAGYVLQQVLNGVPVGAAYALLAVAYALFYGLIGRINLAFGTVAVVGAFGLVNVIGIAVAAMPGLRGGAVAALAIGAVAVGAGLAALVGVATARAVFRPLAEAGTRAFLIATVGLSLFLSEALRLISGSRDAWLQPLLNEPIPVAGGTFTVTTTGMQVFEVVLAATVLAGLMLVMTRSAFGRAWRAVADDPMMARLLGVDPVRIAAATIVLSSALAGVAGAITTLHYGHASAAAGLMIGLKALVAAILGGIGSIPGAAAGGLILGLAETLWSAYLPFDQRDIFVLSLMVIVLVLRPDGLFGLHRPPSDSSDRRWTRGR